MNLDKHPSLVIDLLKKKYGSVLELSFSVYEYHPGSLSDDREIFQMDAAELTSEAIERLVSGLPRGKELALNSVIKISGSEFHIPMVDFATDSKAQLPKLNEYLQAFIGFSDLIWFNSGRSFHGYGCEVISSRDWEKMMGALLLANRPGVPPLIDSRWVGHRLVAGYSALRWSCNAKGYAQMPRLV